MEKKYDYDMTKYCIIYNDITMIYKYTQNIGLLLFFLAQYR